jgi:hypothetical protein
MKTKIILDDATSVVIEPYRLIEQKLRESHFDGHREVNRKYIYYILVKQNGLNDEIWDNPFIHHEHIELYNLILHDQNHEMHLLMKISSISKYEMDHIIDHLEMLVCDPGHYQLIKQNKSFYAREGTPLLDFIQFFRWTQGVV